MSNQEVEVTTNNQKPFYQSKIIWLAIATIFLGAVDQLNLIGAQLPAEYQGIYTIIVGALTLFARTYSGSTITLKK